MKNSNPLRLLRATRAVAMAGLLTASTAFAITITSGNPGNQGTVNVLFNDGSLISSGSLVQGTFSGSGTGYIVDFTSNVDLLASGGQATIAPLSTSTFSTLTFQLENSATFTKAILNPNATANGQVQFDVSYINGGGGVFTDTFSVNANGQNFFGIEAGMGERIVSVTFTGLGNVAFTDASQFRLGGFSSGGDTPAVPDGGATIALLGAAFGALGLLRRRMR